MQNYELTVLIHPDLESQIDAQIDQVKKLVTDNGGTVKEDENWGKKRLAYSIKKQDFAMYAYFEVELPPTAPMKINNVLNITDGVMRHLLVKFDEKERTKIAEAKKASREDEEG